MSLVILVIIKIYLPIIISGFGFLLLFFIKRGKKLGEVEINPVALGVSFFKLKLPISNIALARVVVVCFCLGVLSSLLFWDYSGFFPEHLKVRAYFDKEGIRDALKIFSERELIELGIPANYEEFQNRYYDDANMLLRRIFQKEDSTVFSGKHLHSVGRITFVVEKLAGLQNYYIKEASGELKHTIGEPGKRALHFRTIIEKRDSRHDHLATSPREIFIKRQVIIQPRFKQIFAKDFKEEGDSFDHILVCVTKVYLLPFPRLSSTIYLTEVEGLGLIPVGYAIHW
jgi:hypothetical protein